ncbi:hypothetical protein FBUS_07635 [Fasciolopsis buskii]|uniref:Uncharacterized protein n=1 Tax=Fasciolopsis buskii TaxID=27845 RepID=A0A8E0VFJ7_9TREM|nr:hypothetical protein FBUS_07635 [Fasciolopsis buski]
MGGRGCLTGLTLRHFYGAVEKRSHSGGHNPPCFNDIQDEIFHMIGPANPAYITLDDLIRCGKGDAIVNILTDINGFWTHENREMFATDYPDEAEL